MIKVHNCKGFHRNKTFVESPFRSHNDSLLCSEQGTIKKDLLLVLNGGNREREGGGHVGFVLIDFI